MKQRLIERCYSCAYAPIAIGLGLFVFLCGLTLIACAGNDGTLPTTRDTGVTTTSTTPASVPALTSGITADQIKELLARRAVYMEPEDWEVRGYETLGDWAAARVYSEAFVNQDGQVGHGVVFQKKNDAWIYKDPVRLDDPAQCAIALRNMEAPSEVWEYFGLEP